MALRTLLSPAVGLPPLQTAGDWTGTRSGSVASVGLTAGLQNGISEHWGLRDRHRISRYRGRQSWQGTTLAAQATESNLSAGEAVNEAPGSAPVAHLSAEGRQTLEVEELARPLSEYMSLPASQYSVLDAERIERVDDNTFKCYVHRVKFFSFEVCPVLLVRVDERPNGCVIRLLSCTLEGSPLVVAQNKKFSASMVNNVSFTDSPSSPTTKQMVSETTIKVDLEVAAPFRIIPISSIESTGSGVLQQVLRVMLPRFLAQLKKDYQAWASGDASRKALGTGEL